MACSYLWEQADIKTLLGPEDVTSLAVPSSWIGDFMFRELRKFHPIITPWRSV